MYSTMNLCGYIAVTASDTIIRSVFAQPPFYRTQWFKLIAIGPYRSFSIQSVFSYLFNINFNIVVTSRQAS